MQIDRKTNIKEPEKIKRYVDRQKDKDEANQRKLKYTKIDRKTNIKPTREKLKDMQILQIERQR